MGDLSVLIALGLIVSGFVIEVRRRGVGLRVLVDAPLKVVMVVLCLSGVVAVIDASLGYFTLAGAAGYAVISAISVELSESTKLRSPRSLLLVSGFGLYVTLRSFGAGAPNSTLIAALAAAGLSLAASVLIRNGSNLSFRDASMLLAGYTAALVIAGLVLGDAWEVCRDDKCSLVGELYAGPFESENSIAFIGVIGICLAIATWPGGRLSRQAFTEPSVMVGAAYILLLALSGSRAPMAGLLVGVLIAAVFGFRAVHPMWQRAIGFGVPVVCVVLSIVLISMATVDDYSFRGRLWVQLRDRIGLRSVWGRGLDGWRPVQEALATDRFPHSQIGLLIVFGGWIAVVIYTVVLGMIGQQSLRIENRWQRIGGLALVNTYALTGLLEVVVSPGAPNPLSVLFLLTAVAVFCSSRKLGRAAGVHAFSEERGAS